MSSLLLCLRCASRADIDVAHLLVTAGRFLVNPFCNEIHGMYQDLWYGSEWLAGWMFGWLLGTCVTRQLRGGQVVSSNVLI